MIGELEKGSIGDCVVSLVSATADESVSAFDIRLLLASTLSDLADVMNTQVIMVQMLAF